jgi:hypothetical protein
MQPAGYISFFEIESPGLATLARIMAKTECVLETGSLSYLLPL